MRRLILIGSAVAIAATACQSGPRPTERPETDLIGKPPPEQAEPAPRKTAQPLPEEQPPESDDEELRVELVMLEKGNPYVTESGTRISLVSGSPVKIAFERPDQSEEFELPQGDNYAEGLNFGAVWALTKDDSLHLEWREEPPAPLSVDEARQMAIRELDANLGCEGEQSEAPSRVGTLTLVRSREGAIACSVTIGRYTRRVIER